MSAYLYPYKKKKTYKKKLIRVISFFVLVFLLFFIFSYSYVFGSVTLDEQKQITIPSGFSLNQSAELLASEGIISSSLSLMLINIMENISVKAGDYLFSGMQFPRDVAQRLHNATYGDVYRRLTIPEGSTNAQIGEIIAQSSFMFDQEVFRQESEGFEGYLFPDTYSFLPSTDTKTIVGTLKKTLENKTKPLQSDIQKSGRTFEDIIIMASIIEKEATNDPEEQKIVSGILWKRLDNGQLLQVDAPFQYIHGEVNAADLRKDGPYNTYTRLGLTPTPIGNPGISAIEAALYPLESPYYFYLHDNTATIHYGVTYNNHLNNINRYLR